jgi:ArsR family transcriptional regulator
MAKATKPRQPPASQACCPHPPRMLHPRDTKRFANLFKALGDPTRLEILGLLASAQGEICVCDIETNFRLSQPTVSHHLRILRESGLVRWERRGTWVYYALRSEVADTVGDFHAMLKP